MYDERLATEILKALNGSYPDRLQLDELKTVLPQFASLEDEEWLRAIAALEGEGKMLSRLGHPQFPRSVSHNLTADDHGLRVGRQRIAVREQLTLRDELVGVVKEHRQGV